MSMFITSKTKYLSNDMKIFGTCSIPLIQGVWIQSIEELARSATIGHNLCIVYMQILIG